LKRLILLAAFCVMLVPMHQARAQDFDLAIGFGTLIAPASNATGPSMSGGLYPSFSADYLFHHRFGVQGELSYRASQGLYADYQPYRPVFYDINAIWAPKVGKKGVAEVMGGVGAADVRFYQGYYTCSFVSCTDYVSSTHIMGHVGAGFRYYLRGHIFVRPEANLYLVHTNSEISSGQFSSGQSFRVGASIGYSFTPGF
jgi:hypothetical protein